MLIRNVKNYDPIFNTLCSNLFLINLKNYNNMKNSNDSNVKKYYDIKEKYEKYKKETNAKRSSSGHVYCDY